MIAAGRDKTRIVNHLNPQLEVPFARKEYERRREAVRARMAAAGVDTLYVSDPDSLNYLCGYKALWYQAYGHSGWGPVGGLALHVDSDRALLFDTEKERVLGGYSTLGVEFHLLRRYAKPMVEFIIDDLAEAGWLSGTVGLELGSYRPFPSLSHRFQALLEQAGATVVDATSAVRDARRRKSPSEIAQIRTAARLADAAVERGLELLRPGVSENVLYGEMYRALTAAGGDVPAMTPMVRSGARTAVPHASPSSRTVVPGDLVVLSAYGCFNRYHAFVSRTAIVGDMDAHVRFDVHAMTSKAHELIAGAGESGAAGFLRDATEAYPAGNLGLASGHELGVAMPPDPIGARWFSTASGVDGAFERFEPGDVAALELALLVPELSGCVVVGDTVVFDEGGAASSLSALSPEVRRVGQ